MDWNRFLGLLVLLKRDDSLRKQHDAIPQLSTYAKSRQGTEEDMEYIVARAVGCKWLFYSKGKLVKPRDYVPSDFSNSINDPELMFS